MARILAAGLVLVMIYVLGGCGGGEDTMFLAIPALPARGIQVASEGQGVRIRVLRLEDRRHETAMLGLRRGRFGTLDLYPIQVAGGDVGRAVANAMTRYLRERGWRVRTNGDIDPSFPDVTLTGEVQDFRLDAVATGLSTTMTAKAVFVFEWINQVDGSEYRIPVSAAQERRVYWFTKEDAQRLINEVVAESLEQFVHKVRQDGVLLQPAGLASQETG